MTAQPDFEAVTIRVSQTEAAFAAFWRGPIRTAMSLLVVGSPEAQRSFAKAAFMEGALYATERSKREHGNG